MYKTRNQPTLRHRTFTLLELIVVIVVLGLLSGISVVGYQRIIERAQTTSLEASTGFFITEASALAAFETGTDPSNWSTHIAMVVNSHDLPEGMTVRVQAGDNSALVLSDYGPDNPVDVSATDANTLAADAVAIAFERGDAYTCVTFLSTVSQSSNSATSTYTLNTGRDSDGRDLSDGECLND